MVTCNFFFENNEEGVYTVGQTITGYVELHMDEPKSMRSLKLLFHGDALAYFDQTQRASFVGTEKYLNSETVVFGASDGDTKELPAGAHRYDFEFQLPENIPGSFEYKQDFHRTKAHIRYWVELKMDIKWKLDKEYKREIKVLVNGNLNNFPELALPCSVEGSKTYCCLWCASPQMLMEAWIPYSGFVAGQMIPIRVKYFNKSDKEIGHTSVVLRKIFKMYSSSSMSSVVLNGKVSNDKVAYENGDGVQRESQSVVDINLKVPDVIEASNDKYCKVLTVAYELDVEASGPLCRKNLKLTFPITIGTTPIIAGQTKSMEASTP